MQELRYNGVSTGRLSRTVLEYEWSTDKTAKIKEFEEEATVGMLEIEGHYDAKKKVTIFEEEKGRKTLPGLVIISLMTDKGKISVGY